jgi:hypothetical protein
MKSLMKKIAFWMMGPSFAGMDDAAIPAKRGSSTESPDLSKTSSPAPEEPQVHFRRYSPVGGD